MGIHALGYGASSKGERKQALDLARGGFKELAETDPTYSALKSAFAAERQPTPHALRIAEILLTDRSIAAKSGVALAPVVVGDKPGVDEALSAVDAAIVASGPLSSLLWEKGLLLLESGHAADATPLMEAAARDVGPIGWLYLAELYERTAQPATSRRALELFRRSGTVLLPAKERELYRTLSRGLPSPK